MLSLATGIRIDKTSVLGGFSPKDLSPLIWLDATQMALSNGAAVNTFTDFSGNGNSFVTSGLSGSGPGTFRTNGINGKNSVEGDGVATRFQLGPIGANPTWWGFIICKSLVPILNNSYDLWDVLKFPPDVAKYILFESGQGGVSNSIGYNSNIIANGGGIPFDNSKTFGFLTQSSIVTTTLSDQSGNSASLVTTGVRDNGSMLLFARGDALYWNGQIGELLFGAGALTSGQQTSLWKYASSKWGITTP